MEVYAGTPAASIVSSLSLSEDAARSILGSHWRMPTSTELQELYDNTSHVWTEIAGMKGYLFTSNINGKSIFIPAGGSYNGTNNSSYNSQGFYWSSSIKDTADAYEMNFAESGIQPSSSRGRRFGFNIRPVFDPNT